MTHQKDIAAAVEWFKERYPLGFTDGEHAKYMPILIEAAQQAQGVEVVTINELCQKVTGSEPPYINFLVGPFTWLSENFPNGLRIVNDKQDSKNEG